MDMQHIFIAYPESIELLCKIKRYFDSGRNLQDMQMPFSNASFSYILNYYASFSAKFVFIKT